MTSFLRLELTDSRADRPTKKDSQPTASLTMDQSDSDLTLYADLGITRKEEVAFTIGEKDYETVLKRMLCHNRKATIKAFTNALLQEDRF